MNWRCRRSAVRHDCRLSIRSNLRAVGEQLLVILQHDSNRIGRLIAALTDRVMVDAIQRSVDPVVGVNVNQFPLPTSHEATGTNPSGATPIPGQYLVASSTESSRVRIVRSAPTPDSSFSSVRWKDLRTI